jgi:hypothetical protein
MLIIMALTMIISASCDFPQGFGEGKGSLTIVLPAAPAEDSVPVRNNGIAARAVHLPEAITGLMTYSLEFYPPGGGSSFTVSTGERVVTVELEPGRWAIAAAAWYGSDMAALDKAEVDIQAGRENSVSFTMNADDFITPDISGTWVNQDKNLTTSDSSATLAITLAGTTAFSGISGWTDSFACQKYYEDAGGTRTDIDASPVSFSGPGTTAISFAVNPASLGTGTFNYYAEISNTYTYSPPGGGTSTSGTAKKSIYVARVVVVSSMSYSVGDTGPGGGIIFYVDSTGFTSNGVTCHYLEAAPANLTAAEWGMNGTSVGVTSATIGAGYGNTQTIIAALSGAGETGRSAQLCAAYNGGGFTDWFLPSQGELRELADAFLSLSISTIGGSIWSSTEVDASTALCDGHASGGGGPPWADPKNGTLQSRPIRAF